MPSNTTGETLQLNFAVLKFCCDCSPSGCLLASVEETAAYVQRDGTCKCGLPCPLRLDQVFSYDPAVSNPFTSSEHCKSFGARWWFQINCICCFCWLLWVTTLPAVAHHRVSILPFTPQLAPIRVYPSSNRAMMDHRISIPISVTHPKFFHGRN